MDYFGDKKYYVIICYNMDNSFSLWPMIVLMVIFSYIFMNNLMLTFQNGIYNHLNKAYMALVMGGLMGMIHYIIMIWQGHRTSDMWYGLLLWTMITIIFIILVRRQILITDAEFLKGMIEHHDMALFMSNEIIKKTDDPEIKDFATNIVRTQQEEIDWMKQKLQTEYHL